MVEASAVPRQISRTEYITPKTDQEAKTSQIVTENSSEMPQQYCAWDKQDSPSVAVVKMPMEVSAAREKKCWFCLQVFTPKNPKAHFAAHATAWPTSGAKENFNRMAQSLQKAFISNDEKVQNEPNNKEKVEKILKPAEEQQTGVVLRIVTSANAGKCGEELLEPLRIVTEKLLGNASISLRGGFLGIQTKKESLHEKGIVTGSASNQPQLGSAVESGVTHSCLLGFLGKLLDFVRKGGTLLQRGQFLGIYRDCRRFSK